MLRMRRSRVSALLVALALLAGACGGGDSEDATTTTTSAPSGNDGGTSDTTVAETTTTTAPDVSGDSDSAWCRELRRITEEDGGPSGIDFLTATPDELRENFESVLSSFREAEDLAPPEIEDDVSVMVEAYATFVSKGNEVGWSLNALVNDPEFLTTFDAPEIQAAADRMDAYSTDVCGVDFTTLAASPGTVGPPDVGDIDADDPVGIVLGVLGLPRSLFSDDEVACVVEELGDEFVESITPEWTPTPDALDALFTAVEACGISLG